jgi:hypothetical protein
MSLHSNGRLLSVGLKTDVLYYYTHSSKDYPGPTSSDGISHWSSRNCQRGGDCTERKQSESNSHGLRVKF